MTIGTRGNARHVIDSILIALGDTQDIVERILDMGEPPMRGDAARLAGTIRNVMEAVDNAEKAFTQRVFTEEELAKASRPVDHSHP